MTPKERQVECQGRICKTCLKAGGNCLGSKGKCTTKVPAEALCKGCVAFCSRNKLSPHNLLFCASNHPAHLKPSTENLQKIFDKYFGRPWAMHTRRTRAMAAEIEDDSTPTRMRTDSTDFVDTPIGMGPATALTSPTRYSDIGAAGVELTTEPAGNYTHSARNFPRAI